MSIQDSFQCFHKTIKVEAEELRDKRDILFEKIKAHLKKLELPIPEMLNQGSYIYGVGIKPIEGQEYDIDVGLVFPVEYSEYEAKVVRGWVYEAVVDHTDDVEERGPCVRVRYAAGYHVDLVVYAKNSLENSGVLYLAHKQNIWKPADPKKLKEFIRDAREPFAETKDSSGADQLQRVVRYVKRWNDIAVVSESTDKPSGLALLLLAIHYLPTPVLDFDGEADDLGALIRTLKSVAEITGRVIINKPTQEYEDVFYKLSDNAMSGLKERFCSLLDDLEVAKNQDDDEAAKIIRNQFGEDFPEISSSCDKDDDEAREEKICDMDKAIPKFNNPSRPWVNI